MLTKPFLLAFIAVLAVVAGVGGTQDPLAAAKPAPSPKAEAWQLTGNSGIAAAHFLGTTDNKPLIIKTGGEERMRVDSNGNVGIGTSDPKAALHVTGGDVLMDGGGYNFANPTTSVADLAFFRGGTAQHGMFTMRRYAPEHTVLRIASPPETFFDSYEATLALVRGDEPNQEIVDFYNNGYPSETQYGIRMIKAGTGEFRDFVFDYYDVATKEKREVLRLTADPESSLQIGGYIQLDLTSDVPPPADCASPAHYGRMMVDAGSQLLYICVDPDGKGTEGTWVGK